MRLLILLPLVIGWVNSKQLDDLKEIYENPLAHGFGNDIDWVQWDDAIEKALDESKPIFLLIHKTWCHACKALKKTFQQSNARKAFKTLSQHFIMVNTEDDEEPFEDEYKPDGKYIPRLLFLDRNGDLLSEFKNKKAEYKNYGYYYSSPADILNTMKDVLKHFGVEVPEMKKGEKLKPVKPVKPPKKDDKKKEEKKSDKKSKDDELYPTNYSCIPKVKQNCPREAKCTESVRYQMTMCCTSRDMTSKFSSLSRKGSGVRSLERGGYVETGICPVSHPVISHDSNKILLCKDCHKGNGERCSIMAPNCPLGYECEESVGNEGYLCCNHHVRPTISPRKSIISKKKIVARKKKLAIPARKRTISNYTVAPWIWTLKNTKPQNHRQEPELKIAAETVSPSPDLLLPSRVHLSAFGDD
ncbi:hypothetical protein WR25_18791 [Diploscapter pachys]|uniref:Thioredoxin domain-containing protein n=1 Tax=Diploscapter pachys TaxID=2018661 RepID=A0A2A2JQY6_9BILA|nr:hypothetical protein WR25_18791 [Diploscapter pachys]